MKNSSFFSSSFLYPKPKLQTRPISLSTLYRTCYQSILKNFRCALAFLSLQSTFGSSGLRCHEFRVSHHFSWLQSRRRRLQLQGLEMLPNLWLKNFCEKVSMRLLSCQERSVLSSLVRFCGLTHSEIRSQNGLFVQA